MTIMILPKDEWDAFKLVQYQILERLQQLSIPANTSQMVNYITAKEFMDAVRIKRTKFDQLVAENKIHIIKKGRKIYLLLEEVKRYFEDPVS